MIVPQWIIEKKRDGLALSREEITDFIEGYNREDIPAYQMAALAMAIYLNGMSFEETAFLTEAMMGTGQKLDTSALTLPVCDKHSTGGIGDKVSLILGPLAAACGVAVPMISGRGLGITGGTLDKLESIPGYRTDLSEDEMIAVVEKVGCCIVGQTDRLAPADKKLYGLRDVTATVPSIPLITASIMCKKMSEGLDALVLDVKAGRGAFMKDPEQAKALALNMVRVGAQMNTPVAALISRMDAPLGRCIGNALEVKESIEFLQGKVHGPLWEVTRELTATMIQLSFPQTSLEDARQQVDEALESGKGLEIFRNMIEAQQGDPRVCDDPDAYLPQASCIEDLPAKASGFITDINADAVGRAVLVLGGGRTKSEDHIDHAVGISDLCQIGDAIETGQALLRLHSNQPNRKQQALELLADAITIGDSAPQNLSVILERILPS
ncbi:thymidine phosphorylase [Kiritimatiellota bacterium B12222]|nr:thymidine phosphorylase [Kiritimatiellota bacterium B12222]